MPARGKNQIRIIAGQWRGRRLDFPPVPGLRPTPDRVRETVFNWLAPDLVGARCLDLFAGSGALGLEARSRGAAEVVLVDRHPQVVAHLQQLIARLGMDRVSCHQAAALAWLGRIDQPFDVVFLDPPFAEQSWDIILACLDQAGAVRSGGKIYVEAPHRQRLIIPSAWRLWREGQAGEVSFRLFTTPSSSARQAPQETEGYKI